MDRENVKNPNYQLIQAVKKYIDNLTVTENIIVNHSDNGMRDSCTHMTREPNVRVVDIKSIGL